VSTLKTDSSLFRPSEISWSQGGSSAKGMAAGWKLAAETCHAARGASVSLELEAI